MGATDVALSYFALAVSAWPHAIGRTVRRLVNAWIGMPTYSVATLVGAVRFANPRILPFFAAPITARSNRAVSSTSGRILNATTLESRADAISALATTIVRTVDDVWVI